MTFQERLAKLLSTSFLATIGTVVTMLAEKQYAMALAAVIVYVILDRFPQAIVQIVAVIKGVDRIVEALGMSKVDQVLDAVTATLEGKGAVAGQLAITPPVVATPIADALGKS
jgi:hypothetical protein